MYILLQNSLKSQKRFLSRNWNDFFLIALIDTQSEFWILECYFIQFESILYPLQDRFLFFREENSCGFEYIFSYIYI